LLALVALSPAICEELFFRGALLSGLRRDLPVWRVIAIEMFFFGAVHMSIYRFLPTAILGGVLAALTLRARSLWPAVILHATYNGLLVLEQEGVVSIRPAWAIAAILGAGLFLLVRGVGNGKNGAKQPLGLSL
jgi:membrane protease YdiL (CAAX protease family)